MVQKTIKKKETAIKERPQSRTVYVVCVEYECRCTAPSEQLKSAYDTQEEAEKAWYAYQKKEGLEDLSALIYKVQIGRKMGENPLSVMR